MFKVDWNRENLTYLILRIILIVFTIVCYKVVVSWNDTLMSTYNLLKILSPFFIGFLFAFLINPGVVKIEEYLFKLYKPSKTERGQQRQKKYIRRLSIFIMYFLVFLSISVTLRYILPSLANSVSKLFSYDMDQYNATITGYIEKILLFAGDYVDVDIILSNLERYIPSLSELQSFASKAFPQLLETSLNITSSIFDLVMSIIISVYFIADKERFIVLGKKIVHAFFKPKRADALVDLGSECNYIFKRFFVGKSLDSLIIGILCFFLMKLFKFDYPLLISVIIAFTNMIPYFGPIIGAVPGFFIILFISPQKAFMFLIFVLALQQFDGIILGPKILGDSVGLRPVWIIFSILVGGALFGFVGMLLGVPTFTVIYNVTKRYIDRKLQEKHVPQQLYALKASSEAVIEPDDDET